MSHRLVPPFQVLNSLRPSEQESPRDAAENAAKQLMQRALRVPELRGQGAAFALSIADKVAPETLPPPARSRVVMDRDGLYCSCGALLAEAPSGGCYERLRHPGALPVPGDAEAEEEAAKERRARVLAPIFSSKVAKTLRQKAISKIGI